MTPDYSWPLAGGEPTITSTSANDSVALHIRGLIFSGELAPGDWLPPSRDLATRLGISPVTLRLALKSLEATGYIVTSRGAHGGSRVSDGEALRLCWTRWLADNADTLDDMFELRRTVEGRIAWLAAERRTSDDLVTMENANLLLVAETHSSVLRWNVAFHDSVARAAHSPELGRVMRDVQTRLFLPVDLALREHRIVAIQESHMTILRAIGTQSPRLATERMREHIDGVQDMMRPPGEAERSAE